MSLIFNGLEKEKLLDENSIEYYYQSQDMQTNLADIQRNISVITQNNFNSYKDLLGLLYQTDEEFDRKLAEMLREQEERKRRRRGRDFEM